MPDKPTNGKERPLASQMGANDWAEFRGVAGMLGALFPHNPRFASFFSTNTALIYADRRGTFWVTIS
jgi:hypothetical protein